MYFAQPFIRIATALLIFWMISCEIALPQTVSTRGGTGASFLLAHLRSAPERCARRAGSAAVPRADAEVTGDAPSSCGALPPATPAVQPQDLKQANLEALGKAGQKISRAREKVLEILGAENACSAWFRGKDANPAATFRTLRFELDLHGEEFIRESRDMGPLDIFRNPYVARVIQGDGPYGTVTINPKGAFFSVMARVVETNKEGGPPNMRGVRLLYVGPYAGDTLPAQAVTLLHEFGHVLDILPTDEDNVDGKSVQNTREVLRYCSAELDLLPKRSAVSASH